MPLKYVITENKEFVIFSETLQHKDIARAMQGTPISAGFVMRESNGTFTCSDESMTLDLQSRGKLDEDIINEALNDI